ncbi:MAG: bifunctional oligoribonuclease/PAP phosphatase NrnA [Candidatus Sungbacteria bacterium]|uniref:Bifunctional oligoribonuclease/PAP phosphatase NrnA n=1 Tax=Candidatus Sungiibacteriota bacterium TaxID=2750080 RepID=A0A932YZQ1_9BACT|nr:bifunctional oligoribonuclease/PAP phosphatase NrnA [Candidatus Sungbacteria bacterium]
MREDFAQFKQALERYASIALITHKRPDGDAIGSLLALAEYVQRLGKQAQSYCIDEVPGVLKFLPGARSIKKPEDDFWRSAPAVVLVDCGDISMAGGAIREELAGRAVLNIDHHVSNPRYGAVNLVRDTTAATAEILYQFFTEDGFVIDKHVATCLLCGVYTDTDAFTNLGTTPESLAVSSELLKLGANFRDLTANTMRNKSLASLKLWGRALERLRLDARKGIAVTVLKHADFGECGAEPDDAEGVASLLNHLADVKMSMLLRELPDGTVKGSLRTTHELIDVSQVATLMGGGGHAKAAGFTVKGRIAETENGWKIIE